MAGIPPLYTCVACGHHIDPKGSTSLRLAKVWLKGTGKTVSSIEDESFVYRHEFCRLDNSQQESLF